MTNNQAKVHRCFIGIPLSRQLNKKLTGQCLSLSQDPLFHSFRWVPNQNLHLTLHFLGNLTALEIENLTAALKAQPLMNGPIVLSIDSLSTFPSHNSQKYFAANIKPDDQLSTLHSNLSQRLQNLGLPVETRAFRPHITLARAKRHSRGCKVPVIPFEATETAKHYTLFESVTHATAPAYYSLGHYD